MRGEMGTSDVLSIVAIVIAVFSAIWTFYQHFRWHKPLLTVAGRWFHNSSVSPTGEKYDQSWLLEVSVVNLGDMDTTVVDCYWEFETRDGQIFEIASQPADDSGDIMPWLISSNTRFHPKGRAEFSPSVIPRLAIRSWQIELEARPSSAEVKKDPIRGRAVVRWISRKSGLSAIGEHPNIATSYGPWSQRSPDEAS
jgi:hypothetical protein